MAEPTEYELQRAQRIQQNQRKMEEMGLLAASRGFAAAAIAAAGAMALGTGTEQQPRCKRRKAMPPQPAVMEPTRLSRRLRGETAPTLDEAAAAARAEAEAEGRARARAGGTRKQLRLEPGQQLAAPFSLWSIGVTIWELGHVHRGAWAHRYWSSPGCLYHHAYPVGYRATKVQFGRTYEMRIEEGPTGPLFKVIDQQAGTVFSGGSPTKPWTDVCIAHRTGQRISGPLFFGFSDILTQRAIAANLYNQEELRAALQGVKLEGHAESTEERAAWEFSTVEGVGEATAIVLARSCALGGSRHSGLASLKEWAAASDGNAQALLDYLASSEEIPESTRRWPAWQHRLVPRIVLALSGRWLGAGPLPGVGAGEAESAGEGQEEEGDGAAADEAVAEAVEGGSGGQGMDAARLQPLQEQLLQQQQSVPAAAAARAGVAAAEAAAAAAAPPPVLAPVAAAHQPAEVESKENRQALGIKYKMPGEAVAVQALVKAAPLVQQQQVRQAQQAQQVQRSSRRERKANSKFAEFLASVDDGVDEEAG